MKTTLHTCPWRIPSAAEKQYCSFPPLQRQTRLESENEKKAAEKVATAANPQRIVCKHLQTSKVSW